MTSQEVKNGRLAMIAAAGMILQGCTTHQVRGGLDLFKCIGSSARVVCSLID